MVLTRARVLSGMAAVIAAALVLFFWPREEPGVKDAVTRQIIAMSRAAEDKDVGGVMERVSERFKTTDGWSKQDVHRILAAQVLRGQWVRVFTTDIDVHEVSPTQGEFQARFIFGRSQAEKLEDLAKDSVLNAYAIEGTFEKEADGEWRVVKAKQRRLDPSELL
ncbi:hypothetical protein D7X55_12630 [Corallococcus sp. AB049A]|uniref:Nuclear transport factor 2 family protein n=1 Tax=Corallococcus interemptor TaxID=2316720 RepID=A0A3A8Q1S0_9BACT|nr:MULTISPECIES: hypothetical protein [Corallococcus]RKH51212.1 hypothetical protein D7Y23_10890 [Corallococcus sp. AB050B]RKH61998.1 hypothetical protein D7X96_30680 [Corallococcus interemptor]RKI68307.1 hypothetical protein D7X55_12630 [Corallococcus sp. AB049A]